MISGRDGWSSGKKSSASTNVIAYQPIARPQKLGDAPVVLFAQTSAGEADILTVQQFSPNGMRVLISLLQAYPNYCPYETLLAHLFSLSLDEARRQLREIRKIVLRSVRRAIGSLASGLRAFGLRVRSVRDTGYLVEAIPKASE